MVTTAILNERESNYGTLVSVVVPAFQAQNTIRNCISSIQAQSYRNLECIIIIDGATDDTEKIAEFSRQNDSRIKIIRQRNLGRSAARNNGIHHAHGDWIMFVDADDELDSDAIEKLMAGTKNRNIDIVYGNYRTLSGNGPSCSRQIGEFDISILRKANLNFDNYDFGSCAYAFDNYNCRTCWAKLYSNKILNKIAFPFPEDIRVGEDTCMNYQMLNMARHVTYVDLPVYLYNDNSDGTVRTWNAKDFSSIMSLSDYIRAMCAIDSTQRLNLMAFAARDYLGVFARAARYARLKQCHEISKLAQKSCTDFIRESLPCYLGDRRTVRNFYNTLRIWLIKHDCFIAVFLLQRIGGVFK